MFRRILSLLIALCALMALPLSGLASGADTYLIDVDITNQITTVYRRSDNAVVRQMICSTGTGDRTPLGTFRLEASREWSDRQPWYYISQFHCHVKFATRIKGSILFHSIPYTARDMDSIDTQALAQLGSKASHGCIRLRWQDAEWIAMNCPDGTVVNIFSGAASLDGLRRTLLNESYSQDSGLTYRQFLDIHGDDDGTLALGDRGEAVAALQQALIGHGFFSGDAPTGRYDAATVIAVMRYQSAAKLPVTGVASRALIERVAGERTLYAECATLTPGCSGTLVSSFQRAMRSIGFYTDEITGTYDGALQSAVNAYCASEGIPASDRLTPEFRAGAYALLERLNRRYGADRLTMALVDGKAHWGVAADAIGEAPMDANSVGAGVIALKRRLADLGYFAGAVTPVYDAETVAAVKACQMARGLPANGRASVALQNALFYGDAAEEG